MTSTSWNGSNSAVSRRSLDRSARVAWTTATVGTSATVFVVCATAAAACELSEVAKQMMAAAAEKRVHRKIDSHRIVECCPIVQVSYFAVAAAISAEVWFNCAWFNSTMLPKALS